MQATKEFWYNPKTQKIYPVGISGEHGKYLIDNAYNPEFDFTDQQRQELKNWHGNPALARIYGLEIGMIRARSYKGSSVFETKSDLNLEDLNTIADLSAQMSGPHGEITIADVNGRYSKRWEELDGFIDDLQRYQDPDKVLGLSQPEESPTQSLLRQFRAVKNIFNLKKAMQKCRRTKVTGSTATPKTFTK